MRPWRPCLYRKSDSAIKVMKSAEDRRRYNTAHVLDGAMDRSVFVERPMCPQLVVVGGDRCGRQISRHEAPWATAAATHLAVVEAAGGHDAAIRQGAGDLAEPIIDGDLLAVHIGDKAKLPRQFHLGNAVAHEGC